MEGDKPKRAPKWRPMTLKEYGERFGLPKKVVLSQFALGRLPKWVGWYGRRKIGIQEWAWGNGVSRELAVRWYKEGKLPSQVVRAVQGNRWMPFGQEWWKHEARWGEIMAGMVKEYGALANKIERWDHIDREWTRRLNRREDGLRRAWIRFGKMRRQIERVRKRLTKLYGLLKEADRARRRGALFLDGAAFETLARRELALRRKADGRRVHEWAMARHRAKVAAKEAQMPQSEAV